ncbi:hypothetical protein RJ639_009370 [Escallonia herrerae]|uniref:Protein DETOXIFICATION n=1 Tax=Escallonia herrerae TaxID=1293975 RepID=A0AA88VQY8_9ASTE|nr:hypothetical protein RJ639_009370 [Escallonia herrerae]
METPLLNGGSGERQLKRDDGDYLRLKTFREWQTVFWLETVKLWRIGSPIAFTILCQFGTNSVTNMFVGHIGNIELSAVSIALSVIGTFSFGFMLGMGSALETLCGQAFGAGQVHMLGIYMQRSWIILWVTCIILLPVYIFATPVLKLLGQEDDIADLAGKFAILTIPQLFSLAISFPTQKFLQAQSKVNALAWIGFASLVVHVGLLYLFIYAFGRGTTGAAIAFDITSWGLAVAQVIYVLNWCNEGWTGFSWSAFKEIWAFVRLSLASAVMLCLEICMNLNGWEAMLFIGINAAISVRVSSELGLGHPRATKYAVYVTPKDYFAVIFTSDKDMQQAVARLAYLLGITMILNSVQPVISGVAIGGGWQAIVAYINLGSYYIFGLPLEYLIGYKVNLGVQRSQSTAVLKLEMLSYPVGIWLQVEQTTARMRRWGGQEIPTE